MVYYSYRYIPQYLLPALEQPPKAHKVTWDEVMLDNLAKYPESVQTMYRAIKETRGNDHRVARLDDVTRTMGVAGIATLGSLGLSQPGASLPLWLGGASWMAGMAVTPQIINSAVWLKTGVNLNTHYLNSNGKIRPLYQDPNYMPLQVLSEAERQKMAKRLGVVAAPLDRDRLLQDRLKQIVVQAYTWWMLVAGIATPLFAALFCDTLENPVKDWVTRLKYDIANKYKLKPALRSKNSQDLLQAMNKVMEARIGSGSELTALSRWWYRLPNKALSVLKLDQLPQQVLLHPSADYRFEKMAAHLERQLRRTDIRETLETFIQREEKELNRIFKPIQQLLANETVRKLLPSTSYELLSNEAMVTESTAKATLNGFRRLLKIPIETMSGTQARAYLKQHMEKSVLAYIEQLIRQQKPTLAKQLIGKTQFETVKTQIKRKNFMTAFQQMGDSPKSFLLKATKALGKRRQWVMRYPVAIGGTLLAASLIFLGLFLGEDLDGLPKRSKGGHH